MWYELLLLLILNDMLLLSFVLLCIKFTFHPQEHVMLGNIDNMIIIIIENVRFALL